MKTAPAIQGTWLNSKPIDIESLHGSVAVIVFWSFGCSSSHVRLRQLNEMKLLLGSAVTVIGVHSPRFEYEKDLDNVTNSLVQNNIEIPVLHDTDYETWDKYNPSGWPATVVIGTSGEVVGSQSGSGDISVILEAITLELENPDNNKNLNIDLIRSNEPIPKLGHCTKLSVNSSGMMAVTNPANHCISILKTSSDLRSAKFQGEVTKVINPDGVLITDSEDLYVSDSHDHSLTKYNLDTGEAKVLTKDMVSPAQILTDRDSSLVVTDPGSNQIFRVLLSDPSNIVVGAIAGSGLIGCQDGPAGKAELAHPIGLARTEHGIIFCDAASSKIRVLTDDSKVATLNGECDFKWGLENGDARESLFQRPSDICIDQLGSIIVADTGNNLIRRLVQRKFISLDIAGLNRPEGVTALGSGHLAIANTGNSEIIIVSPDYKFSWVLEIQ